MKVLIFIVAYNAETTLLNVLERIPGALFQEYQVEILVIDDASQDQTFAVGQSRKQSWTTCPLTILKNPKNQGYGGNQKLGYEYAVKHYFDIVALLHGDGQYAPECLPDLIQPIANGEADAVFGSRMLTRGGALRGGMPLYKFIGNKILTSLQNRFLHTNLSEFHSGYRVYAVNALKTIPFQYNSNVFHFDTDIIIQLVLAQKRIKELPIPTYYGDEICHVNGLKYAKDVILSTLGARIHQMGLRYQRKFDVTRQPGEQYALKTGYRSSHTLAIAAVPDGTRVMDIGCGPGLVANELLKKGCVVTGIDLQPPIPDYVSAYIRWDVNDSSQIPPDIAQQEYVLLLDILEHLARPEQLFETIRRTVGSPPPIIILTTPNIAFGLTRLLLLFGQFNYGVRGILDFTHTRLFTFASMKQTLIQSGYEILEITGIPAPFPQAIGNRPLSQALVTINTFLIRLSKALFSYQIYMKVRPLPTIDSLLQETIVFSAEHGSHCPAEKKCVKFS